MLGKHGVAISKKTNRIKVLKFCLLNACKREYGIEMFSQVGTVRIKGVDLNCEFDNLT
jgi:hypothetical protein